MSIVKRFYQRAKIEMQALIGDDIGAARTFAAYAGEIIQHKAAEAMSADYSTMEKGRIKQKVRIKTHLSYGSLIADALNDVKVPDVLKPIIDDCANHGVKLDITTSKPGPFRYGNQPTARITARFRPMTPAVPA